MSKCNCSNYYPGRSSPQISSTASPLNWSQAWTRYLTRKPTSQTQNLRWRVETEKPSQILIDKYFQAIIKEEFSYYNSSGPKYENFSKYLTINEMVRIHYDPYISQFDLSKQPILVRS